MARKNNSKKNKDQKSADPLLTKPSDFGFLSNITLHYILIAAMVIVLYANTLGHEYTQDDAIVIYDNMYTTDGMSGIPGLLGKDTFHGFFKKEGKAKLVSGGRYRPLTPIMFAVGWEIFGDNPLIGHLWNIIWYALLGILLYKVLSALLINRKPTRENLLLVLVATLIFIAHPVHTEVVANIKGRDEIICLLGSLLALYLVLRPAFKSSMINNLAIGLVFFLALMAKENAINFIAVVPMALYMFRDIKIASIIKKTAPLLVGAVVFLFIRSSVLGMDFGGTPRELMNNPFLKYVGGQYVDFSFGEKLATIIYSMGKYLQLLVAPYNLTHDYYPKHIPMMSFGNWQVWLSIVAFGVLKYFGLAKFKRNSVMSFSILFFLGTIFIVSNVIFPIGTNLSERFLFMPSIGFALLLAYLMVEYVYKTGGMKVFMGLAVVIFSLYAAKTITRNQVWSSDDTLFLTDVHNSPNSAKVRNAAGGTLLSQYAKLNKPGQNEEMLEDALAHLNKAVAIHPDYQAAYLLLGNANFYKKNYPAAIDYYNKVLELYPGKEDALRNIGVAYRDYGKYFGEQKNDLTSALKYLKLATEINPLDTETLRLLGVCNGVAGKHTEAISYFKKITELLPNNARAFTNLSKAYNNAGDTDRGIFYQKKALEIDPNAFN